MIFIPIKDIFLSCCVITWTHHNWSFGSITFLSRSIDSSKNPVCFSTKMHIKYKSWPNNAAILAPVCDIAQHWWKRMSSTLVPIWGGMGTSIYCPTLIHFPQFITIYLYETFAFTFNDLESERHGEKFNLVHPLGSHFYQKRHLLWPNK